VGAGMRYGVDHYSITRKRGCSHESATEQCFCTVAQGVRIIKTFMARSRQTLGIAECNSRSRREQYLLNELR
jgi:hypothetical protein